MADSSIVVSSATTLDTTQTQTNLSGTLTNVQRERVVLASDRTSATIPIEDVLHFLQEIETRNNLLLRGIYLQLAHLNGLDTIEDGTDFN